jgi:hypothetical protein
MCFHITYIYCRSGSDGGAILTARHVLYSCLDGALRYDLFLLKRINLFRTYRVHELQKSLLL